MGGEGKHYVGREKCSVPRKSSRLIRYEVQSEFSLIQSSPEKSRSPGRKV